MLKFKTDRFVPSISFYFKTDSEIKNQESYFSQWLDLYGRMVSKKVYITKK